jgi:hypothetical protein
VQTAGPTTAAPDPDDVPRTAAAPDASDEPPLTAHALAEELKSGTAGTLSAAGLSTDGFIRSISPARLQAVAAAERSTYRTTAQLYSTWVTGTSELLTALWKTLGITLPIAAAAGAAELFVTRPKGALGIVIDVAEVLIVVAVFVYIALRIGFRIYAVRERERYRTALLAATDAYVNTMRRGVREEARAAVNRARLWSPEQLHAFNRTGDPDVADLRSGPGDQPTPDGANAADGTRRPVLSALTADGLAELDGSKWEISTDAIVRMRRLMAVMPGGTIGVAGPRGVGKTTLLSTIARENEGLGDDDTLTAEQTAGLSVTVSAPVEYDTMAFVTTILARACERVLRGTAGDDGVPWRAPDRRAPMAALLARFARVLPWVAGGALAVAYGWDLLHPRHTRTSTGVSLTNVHYATGYVVIAIGAATIFTAYLVSLRLFLRRPRFGYGRDGRLAERAFELHEQLSYQQKSVQGRKSTWQIPQLGAGLEHSRSDERARRELTHPELVSTLRDFLGQAVDAHAGGIGERSQTAFPPASADGVERGAPSAGQDPPTWPTTLDPLDDVEWALSAEDLRARVLARPLGSPAPAESAPEPRAPRAPARVVVVIDELDKLQSAETARKLLNELKALFGIRGCFFLLSVSEDAMASFETRGLPFRDAFDSALDEVVTVRPLTFDESRQLLFRRIDEIELPFIALLHCISAGIPRDLIRAARDLVLLSQDAGDTGMPLSAVCARIVRQELDDKADALVAATRSVRPRPPERILAFAERIRQTPAAEAELLALAAEAIREKLGMALSERNDEPAANLRRVCEGLVAFLHFLAAVVAHFTDELTEARVAAHEDSAAQAVGIDLLARARHALADGSKLPLVLLEQWQASSREVVNDDDDGQRLAPRVAG